MKLLTKFEGVHVHTNRPRQEREETFRLKQPTQKEISMLKSLALTITLVAFAAFGTVYAQTTTPAPPPTERPRRVAVQKSAAAVMDTMKALG